MDKEQRELLQNILQSQQDTMRLIAVLVKRGTLQASMIQELSSVGMAPKRIAELLDTSPNTVSVAISNAKKKGKTKKK